jgi:hypothetical protein
MTMYALMVPLKVKPEMREKFLAAAVEDSTCIPEGLQVGVSAVNARAAAVGLDDPMLQPRANFRDVAI